MCYHIKNKIKGDVLMEKILVSACLLGCKCRYDAQSKEDEKVISLMDSAFLIPICPEILGGLSTPRPRQKLWKIK